MPVIASCVRFFGALFIRIVDYFYTQDPSGRGLDKEGTILIEHDPLIMEPNLRTSDGKEFDPFHVSIGKVKTVFAIKSGEISK